jgi:antitoxin component YwqK of YwqJK toxin-antitoxin module
LYILTDNSMKRSKIVILILSLTLMIECNHSVKLDDKYENGKLKYEIIVIKDKYGKLEKHGRSIWYYQNGFKKLECYYNKNIVEGKSTSWYQNGNIEGESIYSKGIKNGRSTSWYENGNKKQTFNYKNGKIDGIDSCWYSNGKLRWVVNYRNDTLSGQFNRLYENGQMEMTGNNIDTVFNGKITGWFNNGVKMVEFVSNMGNIDSTSLNKWDSLGNPVRINGKLVSIRQSLPRTN